MFFVAVKFCRLSLTASRLLPRSVDLLVFITGCNVVIPREVIVLNSIVLPHKELNGSHKNQIIL